MVWRIPVLMEANSRAFIDEQPNQKVYSAYSQKTKKDLAPFLHGCAGYPKQTTWIDAIQTPNQFATWPEVTVELVSKNLEKQTTMGHMTNV